MSRFYRYPHAPVSAIRRKILEVKIVYRYGWNRAPRQPFIASHQGSKGHEEFNAGVAEGGDA